MAEAPPPSPLYACDRCGYATNYKAYLMKHLHKKVPCKALYSSEPQHSLVHKYQQRSKRTFNTTTGTYDCYFCQRPFTSSSGKCRHQKTCHQRRHREEEERKATTTHQLNEAIMRQIETSVRDSLRDAVFDSVRDSVRDTVRDTVRDMVPNLIQQQNTSNNNTTHTINHNNTNISVVNNNNNSLHIHIQPFGQENLEYLLEPENGSLKRILEERGPFIQNVVKEVHYNEDHPENMNMYISNVRGKHALIYNGKQFELKLKDEYLKRMMDSKRSFIEGHYDRVGLDEETKQYIKEKIDKLNQDKHTQEQLLEKLELLCYNQRTKVKAVHDGTSAKPEEPDDY